MATLLWRRVVLEPHPQVGRLDGERTGSLAGRVVRGAKEVRCSGGSELDDPGAPWRRTWLVEPDHAPSASIPASLRGGSDRSIGCAAGSYITRCMFQEVSKDTPYHVGDVVWAALHGKRKALITNLQEERVVLCEIYVKRPSANGEADPIAVPVKATRSNGLSENSWLNVEPLTLDRRDLRGKLGCIERSVLNRLPGASKKLAPSLVPPSSATEYQVGDVALAPWPLDPSRKARPVLIIDRSDTRLLVLPFFSNENHLWMKVAETKANGLDCTSWLSCEGEQLDENSLIKKLGTVEPTLLKEAQHRGGYGYQLGTGSTQRQGGRRHWRHRRS